MEDLDLPPFSHHGGPVRAHQVFGDQLNDMLKELNEALAA